MTYSRNPWETDPDAWKDSDGPAAEWHSGEPWKIAWWEHEAEGYGHSATDGFRTDP